jgi:hypothetical protein
VIVGDRECIFHHLPEVVVYGTLEEAKAGVLGRASIVASRTCAVEGGPRDEGGACVECGAEDAQQCLGGNKFP